jgi:hypothetical protein
MAVGQELMGEVGVISPIPVKTVIGGRAIVVAVLDRLWVIIIHLIEIYCFFVMF